VNFQSTVNLTATGIGGGISILTSQKDSASNYDAYFNGTTQILANGGAINLLGGQTISGSVGIAGGIWNLFGYGYIGSKANSLVTSSSSNITIGYDNFSWALGSGWEPYFATTGTVTIQPATTSFGGIDTNFFSFNQNSQTMTGLTIGKTVNTSAISLNSTAISAAGPINIYGGNLTVNVNLTSTGQSSPVLLKASGSITVGSGVTLQTNNGSLVLWSNSTGSTSAGGIWFGDSDTINTANGVTTQTSGGGNITLGGGSSTTTDLSGFTVPSGAATSNVNHGIYFGSNSSGNTYTTINTGGGNLSLNGSSLDGGAGTNGVLFDRTTYINTGVGGVNITGNTTGAWNGIELETFGQFNLTAGGNITMNGTATTGAGIKSGFSPGMVITSTGSGSINLNGSSLTSSSGFDGIFFTGGTQSIISNSGNINITGTGYSNGVYISNANLLSHSGKISLNSQVNPLYYQGSFGSNGVIKPDGSSTASSSNVVLTGDSQSFGTTTVTTSGTQTLQSYSTSFSSSLNWPISNLNLSASLSGLTIGSPTNTSTVTVSGATSIAGPISIYAGTIAVNANLISTNSGSNILLKSTGGITTAASVTVQTNNGNITFWSDSQDSGAANSSASGSGTISIANNNMINSAGGSTTQSTGGGTIILAGAMDNGSGAPSGYAKSSAAATGTNGGVFINHDTSIYSGGGNITIRGSGTGSNARGFENYGSGLMINSGGGTIDIEGVSVGGHGTEFGFGSGCCGINTVQSSATTGTAILIKGSTSTSNTSGYQGLWLYGYSATQPFYVIANGGGSISLVGSANVSNGYGVQLRNTDILSSSGAITINGGVQGIQMGLPTLVGLSSASGSPVTTSSSSITLIADRLSFSSSTYLSSTGALNLAPYTSGTTIGVGSGAGSLSLPASIFTSYFGSNFSSITIGNSSSGDVTVGGALTFVDNLSLVSGGNVVLSAGSSITDSKNGGYIALGATANFINNSGSSALSETGTSGRWLVYSASPASDTFGSLNSGNDRSDMCNPQSY
jgi:hypothetical protein